MESSSTLKLHNLTDDMSQPQPVFKVTFRNETISRTFRNRIKQFLEELLSTKPEILSENDDNNTTNLTLEIWDSDLSSDVELVEVTTESEHSETANSDLLFTVDTQPTFKNDFDVPTYGKKYETAFEKTNSDDESASSNKYISKIECFNCNGNHNLRDCQAPRNFENIKKNRKNMKVGQPRSARYHLDDDQKFGHMIPGQMSSALRNALGLKKNELPKHIYRMRTLGYPPGWLEEARLQHSGLMLFNSDGTPAADEDTEPGEICDSGNRDLYDVKKIFDYPGFNVPPPTGTHDDFESEWTPQKQALHSKQTMLLMLKGKKAEEGYKRKKLRASNTVSKDDSNTTPSNMEIEEGDVEDIAKPLPLNGLFQPPLPPGSPSKPPEPPPLPSSPSRTINNRRSLELRKSPSPRSQEGIASPSDRMNSPSLFDLENMKKRLLVELEASSSQSNSDISTEGDCTNSKKAKISRIDGETSEGTELTSLHNTSSTNQGNIKSVDFGTPILQSSSPYSKLPSSEKFSKNICDVINFENLPDSTGKYEQMTGVLHRVRSTLAKLNQTV